MAHFEELVLDPRLATSEESLKLPPSPGVVTQNNIEYREMYKDVTRIYRCIYIYIFMYKLYAGIRRDMQGLHFGFWSFLRPTF